ncbi:hypothetical protein GNI_020560, partial [Gregarina niphandrodes]
MRNCAASSRARQPPMIVLAALSLATDSVEAGIETSAEPISVPTECDRAELEEKVAAAVTQFQTHEAGRSQWEGVVSATRAQHDLALYPEVSEAINKFATSVIADGEMEAAAAALNAAANNAVENIRNARLQPDCSDEQLLTTLNSVVAQNAVADMTRKMDDSAQAFSEAYTVLAQQAKTAQQTKTDHEPTHDGEPNDDGEITPDQEAATSQQVIQITNVDPAAVKLVHEYAQELQNRRMQMFWNFIQQLKL